MAGTPTARARRLLPLVLGAVVGCGGAARPNVLVVVIDTLRADHLGAYGAPAGSTPFLDRLGRRGTVFDRAFAASSWTAPSVASLFTSRYASQHHVTTYDARLPDAERTLAETFADAGYRTIGVTANFRLSPALGFAQGFARWDDRWSAPKTRANAVRRHAVSALDAAPRSSQPVLLYLQYMEPHPPYAPPPAYRRRYERHAEVGPDANARLLAGEHDFTPAEIDHLHSLYEGEVAYLDHEIARLFAALAHRGFLDDVIVVVTADHGEEFREHGLMGHGRSLYNAALRVPLVLAGARIPAGRVRDAVSLVDLAPTLAALAGLRPETTWEGRSLVPLLAGPGTPADVVAELLPDGGPDLRRHSAAIVRGRLKLLLMTEPWAAAIGDDIEAYDLDTDMPEAAPATVFLGMPAEAASLPALRQALRDTLARLGTRAAPAAERGAVDEETRRRLRALGYVH
jgi:arylsulfatase A-like enzyme